MYDHGIRPAHRVGLPVISVGNLTTGGTGKTPLVAYLARWIQQHGARVIVLSRGYGRSKDAVLNDEGKVLKRIAPGAVQLQGKDRLLLARYAEQHFAPAVLLLDDGFQHRRLHRDLDIVLVDATNPFGHSALLPRGLLREPLDALRRANLIVLTRGDQVTGRRRFELRSRLRALSGDRPLIEATVEPVALVGHGPSRRPLGWLSGRRILAFCGVGNPTAFFAQLEQLGARLQDSVTFPDHHGYEPHDLQRLLRRASALGAEALITTEKDLVKIPRHWVERLPLFAVRIELRVITGARLLHAALRQLALPQLVLPRLRRAA